MADAPLNSNTSSITTASMSEIKDLSSSRLWLGVPQITLDNIRQYDPAYTGHTFLFVTNIPVFLEKDKGPGPTHMGNLKALIERASTGFSGPGNKTVNFVEQTDGYSNRKLSHPVSVTKDVDEITVKIHEFKGLILKNALEYWVDGMIDERSQHAHYYGQVADLEYSIKNHTMGMLAVQVDPSWYQIQDAAWYHNMIPSEVSFDHFNWEKGQAGIVEDTDVRFKCNEERSNKVNDAAISYMNNKILNNLDAYFDRRTFDPNIPVPSGPQTL